MGRRGDAQAVNLKYVLLIHRHNGIRKRQHVGGAATYQCTPHVMMHITTVSTYIHMYIPRYMYLHAALYCTYWVYTLLVHSITEVRVLP